jgi:hypothetical protein
VQLPARLIFLARGWVLRDFGAEWDWCGDFGGRSGVGLRSRSSNRAVMDSHATPGAEFDSWHEDV